MSSERLSGFNPRPSNPQVLAQLPWWEMRDIWWGPPDVVAQALQVQIASSPRVRLPNQSLGPSPRRSRGSSRSRELLSLLLLIEKCGSWSGLGSRERPNRVYSSLWGRTVPRNTPASGPFPRSTPVKGLGRSVCYGIPCPCPRSGPSPNDTPNRAPSKMVCNKWEPVQGMSPGGPQAGARWEFPQNTPPGPGKGQGLACENLPRSATWKTLIVLGHCKQCKY